ncbi:MAG TPA: hypothetical protein VKA24_12160 [Gaiellaceae bacterium]|nr:hypothetical protein [Gaiellaceae bacterium]
MSDIPDELTLKFNRDREGKRDVLARRIAVGAITVFLALALLNLFGQRPSTTAAEADAATLEVYAPKRVRGGLFYEARFTIDARQEVEEATLVLDPGWVEGITINTVEPTPIGEASRDGKLVFELGRIPGGETHVFYLQLQVNPTNVGHRSQDVRLYDGDELLTTIDRSITVFP